MSDLTSLKMVKNFILVSIGLALVFFALVHSLSNKRKKIVDSDNCTNIEHTFMVAIFQRYPANLKISSEDNEKDTMEFIGGGTLLSERWVLTAGYNLIFLVHQYIAVVGIERLSEFKERRYVQRSPIKNFYKTKELQSNKLYLVVAELENSIKKSARVSFVPWLINIPDETFEDICKTVTVMGYGNSYDSVSGIATTYENLHCREVPILPHNSCKPMIPLDFLPYQAACIVSESRVCNGDSGGPVMCNGTQYGVISGHHRCGLAGPTLFTKVYEFRVFILKAMAKLLKPDLRQIKTSANNCYTCNSSLNLIILGSLFYFIIY